MKKHVKIGIGLFVLGAVGLFLFIAADAGWVVAVCLFTLILLFFALIFGIALIVS